MSSKTTLLSLGLEMYEKDTSNTNPKHFYRPKNSKILFQEYYNATRLGEEIGITGAMMNRRLLAFGFIEKIDGKWFPTSKAVKFCSVMVIADSQLQIRWNPSIISEQAVKTKVLTTLK